MTADYNGWNDAPEEEREAMDVYQAGLDLAADSPRVAERPRVWRPFPEQVSQVLCLEDLSGDVAPRIHGRARFPADTDHRRQGLQKVC